MATNSFGNRLQRVLARVGLALAGIVFALVLLEVALRIVTLPNRFNLNNQLIQQWEPDPELLLRLRPNLNLRITAHPEFSYTVQTNADGLRDEPLEGAFDIATIGDSMTFGFGVDAADTYSTQLEEQSGWRVLNLGWAGWNSHVYPVTAQRYATPSEATVWVWGFFINDLRESIGAEDFLAENDATAYYDQAVENAQVPFPLNLQVMQTLGVVFDSSLTLLPDSGDALYQGDDFTMLASTYPWRMTDPTAADVQRGWDITADAIQQTATLAEANNATLVLMYIPPREHVYWQQVSTVLPDYDITQLDEVAAQLEAIAADNAIPYINLLPPLRDAAADGDMLYFPSDGHFNPAGHAVTASVLYEEIVALGLLE